MAASVAGRVPVHSFRLSALVCSSLLAAADEAGAGAAQGLQLTARSQQPLLPGWQGIELCGCLSAHRHGP